MSLFIFLLKKDTMVNGSAHLIHRTASRLLGCLLLVLLLTPPATLKAQQIVFPTETEEVPGAMHVVQKGETLYGIAKQYKTGAAEIKQLNGMKDATIYPGQMLIVSNKTTVARTQVSRSTSSPAAAYRSASGSTTPASSLNAYTRQLSDKQAGPSSLVAAELKILAETPVTRTQATDPLEALATTRGGETLAPVAPVSALPAKVTTAATEWYRVQAGDDLYSIADTYEVRPEDISAWNDGIRTVRPGDVLIVRREQKEVSRESLAYDTQTRSMASMQRAAGNQVSGNSDWGTSRGEVAPTSIQTLRGNLTTGPAQYINSRDALPAAAAKVESGKFVRFEYPGLEKARFYGIHKSLPQGTRVKMGIPDNPGYIEVIIIGKLDYQSPAIIGLSPACLQILEGAGNPKEISIAYD
jgi:LysM repeat protein